MQRATVPEEIANEILGILVKDRIRKSLDGAFQGLKEIVRTVPAKDQAVVRFALLNMVEESFREITEEQRRRVSSQTQTQEKSE